jgi:hypothetical protein
MRNVASLLLAIAVALAAAWGGVASASPSGEPAAMAGCHDMVGMGDMPAPSRAPNKSPAEGCSPNCAIGCAVPPPPARTVIADLVAWRAAFGPPMTAPNRASAMLEAEDPPPRTAFA